MSKERPFEGITPVPNIKVGYFEKEAYLEIIDRKEKQIEAFADQIRALQSRIDILEKSQRPHGEWEDYSGDFYKCPECGYLLNKLCPRCHNKVILPKGGAEMRGDDNESD